MLDAAQVDAGKGPRYRVIAKELLDAIRSGKLAVGTRMPGELDLMKTYDVSRHTILVWTEFAGNQMEFGIVLQGDRLKSNVRHSTQNSIESN